jgi:thymidylate kinase
MNEQRIIIFDGPDGCGKTNIAQELSALSGITYFKNEDEHRYFRSDPSYFINAIRYVDRYFTSYLEKSGSSIILDRAWPSEWIYSQAMDRETDMETLRELDIRHAKLGTTIIIPFRSDYSGVDETYPELQSQLQNLDRLYRKFAEWSQCRTIMINVDDEDLDREIRELQQQLNLQFIKN